MFAEVVTAMKRFNLSVPMVSALRWNVDRRDGAVSASARTLKSMTERGLIRAGHGAHYLTPWGVKVRQDVRKAAGMEVSPILVPVTGQRSKSQIVKGSALSPVMMDELLYGRTGTGPVYTDDSNMLMPVATAVALIDRGLVTSGTRHTLTPMGVMVVHELLASEGN